MSIDDGGRVEVDEVVRGDTVAEVLGYVQIESDDLSKAIRLEAEVAVQGGRLTADESRSLQRFYEEGLRGYTYLE